MSCKVFQGPAELNEAKRKCGSGRKALFRHKIRNQIIPPGPAVRGVGERERERGFRPNTSVWQGPLLWGPLYGTKQQKHQNSPVPQTDSTQTDEREVRQRDRQAGSGGNELETNGSNGKACKADCMNRSLSLCMWTVAGGGGGREAKKLVHEHSIYSRPT